MVAEKASVSFLGRLIERRSFSDARRANAEGELRCTDFDMLSEIVMYEFDHAASGSVGLEISFGGSKRNRLFLPQSTAESHILAMGLRKVVGPDYVKWRGRCQVACVVVVHLLRRMLGPIGPHRKTSRRSTSGLRLNPAVNIKTLRLVDVLSDHDLMKAFRRFLQLEHSLENLEFWIDCEAFARTKFSSQAEMKRAGQDIHARYLRDGAEYELNLSCVAKRGIQSLIEQSGSLEPTMFKPLQDEVCFMMAADAFPRFLKSTILLKEFEAEDA